MRDERSIARENGTRPRRWMRPALVLSLMFNLLVLGVLCGAVWASRDDRWSWQGGEHKGLAGFVGSLPRERSAELGKIMEAEQKNLEPLWSDFGRARRDVIEGLVIEPFDRAKLESLLARYNEVDGRIRAGRTRKFTEVVLAMTAGERRAFRDWKLAKRHGWWWSRRHGDDRDGGERPRE